MSMWSAVQEAIAVVAASPKFANLAAGNSYALNLSNQSGADIVAGTMTIEGADAKADDHCAPDVWAALQVVPACDAAPGTVTGPATITLSAQNPIKDKQVCAYSVECPKQFIRVAGVPAGLDAIVVLTHLKRTA